MVERRREVELFLCFGNSEFQSSFAFIQEAVKVGFMPMLNQLSVIGLISIPGMMTGEILGGSSPMLAARYQILIMYLIAQSCFAGLLTGILATLRVGFGVNNWFSVFLKSQVLGWFSTGGLSNSSPRKIRGEEDPGESRDDFFIMTSIAKNSLPPCLCGVEQFVEDSNGANCFFFRFLDFLAFFNTQ